MALSLEIWFEVSQRTYGPELKHTVRSVTKDFITGTVLFSLFYSYFSKNRTNRRFFIDLENLNHLEFSETLFNLGEF
jgi:hypothetical protein